MFDSLEAMPPDALLALIKLFNADDRSTKVDLGVGVYRTADGGTPVFRAVKEAERRLLETQDSKAYLGPEGDMGFVEALVPHVFGPLATADRLAGIQTPGGTGAVRLACDLLKRAGAGKVLLGTPSWPNHAPIAKAAGLDVVSYTHCDLDSQALDFDALLGAMQGATSGDVVLLHGCCHNPTGIDYSAEQWHHIAAAISAKGLLPLIDLAYQGLGKGFEEDAAGMRIVLDHVPEALIAYSCDKNFGVYRDRVGALYSISGNSAQRDIVNSNMLALARSNWSMPPDHGAAAARIVLQDEGLTRIWLDEVTDMRARLAEMRALLAAEGQIGTANLAAVGQQNGLFSTLKLSPEKILALCNDHGIYMAGSGRINVAGFTHHNARHFIDALKAVAD